MEHLELTLALTVTIGFILLAVYVIKKEIRKS